MAALAKHCTEQEDAAAILLESRIGEQFDAIVIGVQDKGTWVHLLHLTIEGNLESGDVGQRLRVQLVHTDVEHGDIDFKKLASGAAIL